MSDLQLCPIILRTAQSFVNERHRHNSPLQGHKFSISLTDNEELVGVSTMKAVGFREDGMTKDSSNGWNMPGRRRTAPERCPKGSKIRWMINFEERKNGAKNTYEIKENDT